MIPLPTRRTVGPAERCARGPAPVCRRISPEADVTRRGSSTAGVRDPRASLVSVRWHGPCRGTVCACCRPATSECGSSTGRRDGPPGAEGRLRRLLPCQADPDVAASTGNRERRSHQTWPLAARLPAEDAERSPRCLRLEQPTGRRQRRAAPRASGAAGRRAPPRRSARTTGGRARRRRCAGTPTRVPSSRKPSFSTTRSEAAFSGRMLTSTRCRPTALKQWSAASATAVGMTPRPATRGSTQ